MPAEYVCATQTRSRSDFRCAAIRSAAVRWAKRDQQRNRVR